MSVTLTSYFLNISPQVTPAKNQKLSEIVPDILV